MGMTLSNVAFLGSLGGSDPGPPDPLANFVKFDFDSQPFVLNEEISEVLDEGTLVTILATANKLRLKRGTDDVAYAYALTGNYTSKYALASIPDPAGKGLVIAFTVQCDPSEPRRVLAQLGGGVELVGIRGTSEENPGCVHVCNVALSERIDDGEIHYVVAYIPSAANAILWIDGELVPFNATSVNMGGSGSIDLNFFNDDAGLGAYVGNLGRFGYEFRTTCDDAYADEIYDWLKTESGNGFLAPEWMNIVSDGHLYAADNGGGGLVTTEGADVGSISDDLIANYTTAVASSLLRGEVLTAFTTGNGFRVANVPGLAVIACSRITFHFRFDLTNFNNDHRYFKIDVPGTTNSFLAYLHSDGTLHFQIGDGEAGDGNTHGVVDAFVSSQAVQNIVVVYNGEGETPAEKLVVAINGEQQSLAFDGTLNIPESLNLDTQLLYIMGDPSASGGPVGCLYHFNVLQDALLVSEAEDLSSEPAMPTLTVTTTTVAWPSYPTLGGGFSCENTYEGGEVTLVMTYDGVGPTFATLGGTGVTVVSSPVGSLTLRGMAADINSHFFTDTTYFEIGPGEGVNLAFRLYNSLNQERRNSCSINCIYSHTAFLDINASDGLAVLNNPALPFQSPTAALNALQGASGAPWKLVMLTGYSTFDASAASAAVFSDLTIYGQGNDITEVLLPDTSTITADIKLVNCQIGNFYAPHRSAGTSDNFGTITGSDGTAIANIYFDGVLDGQDGDDAAYGSDDTGDNGAPAGPGGAGNRGEDANSNGSSAGHALNGDSAWASATLLGTITMSGTVYGRGKNGGNGGRGGDGAIATAGNGSPGGDAVDDGMGGIFDGGAGGNGGDAYANGGNAGNAGAGGNGTDLSYASGVSFGLSPNLSAGVCGNPGDVGEAGSATPGSGGNGGNGINGGSTGSTGTNGNATANDGSTGSTAANGTDGTLTAL